MASLACAGTDSSAVRSAVRSSPCCSWASTANYSGDYHSNAVRFAGSSELSGCPSNPRRALHLSFKFAPALPLLTEDTVTFAMPGFTLSTFQRDPPLSITVLGTSYATLKLPIVSPVAGMPSKACLSTHYLTCTCSRSVSSVRYTTAVATFEHRNTALCCVGLFLVL
jgi:hypothetical protein